MSRAQDESVEQWYARSVQDYATLQDAERHHWKRLGFDRKGVPGEAYPLIDPEFAAAMEMAKQGEAELKEAAAAVARYRQSC